MYLKAQNSDFHFYGFLLGIASCVFYAFNSLVALSEFAQIYFLFFALISIVPIFTNFLGDAKPVAILFFILAFPEYGANPYNEEFFSPFYYQKYVIILFCISMFNLKIRPYIIYLISGLLISWLLSFYYEINGAVVNEIVQLFILISFLNIKIYESNQKLVMTFLLSFIAFCFITSILIDLFGLYSYRTNGGKVYIYGHWYGILVGYFIYTIRRIRLSLQYKLLLSIFFCFSLILNINSLQSAHLIFIVLCIFFTFRIFERINVRSIFLSFIFCYTLYLLSAFLINYGITTGEYAWLFKKGLQVLNLSQLDVTAIDNSPLIRMNEILSIFQQSNLIQLLIGRGFASTYELGGAYWELTNLHSATFPLDQIESGILQMVHETATYIFKWSGFIGLFSIYFISIRILRREGFYNSNLHFIILMIALFLLSSIQTGLLCLMLIKYFFGTENHHKKSSRILN